MGWLSKTWKKVTSKPVLGAVLGGFFGYSLVKSREDAKKASAQAEADARRQEIMANAAPTTVQAPGATTLKADVTREDVAGERRRRLSINKTAGLGISRMANSYGKRQTLG